MGHVPTPRTNKQRKSSAEIEDCKFNFIDMLNMIINQIVRAFTRQIGRDAGKVVTNKMFGDKHATPYRRTQSKRRK